MVVTTGSLSLRLWQHWLALLYAFEIAVALAAALVTEPATRNIARSALGLQAVPHPGPVTLACGPLDKPPGGVAGWVCTRQACLR